MVRSFAVLIPRRRWLIIGACVSTAGHLLVMGGYLFVGDTVREVVHRITFEPLPPPSVFWKPPRATARVLEFRKQPVPSGSYQRQKTKVAKTRVQEVWRLAAMRTENLLNQLDASKIAPPSLRQKARMGMGSGVATDGAAGVVALALPTLSDVEVKGVKESRQQVDMSLDLLAIQDMDTGQYQAMVIQDPDDRRRISGYIHLAQVFSLSRGFKNAGTEITRYQNLDFLIKALDEYTGIEADYLGPIPLDDPRLVQVPWLLLPSWFGTPHSLTDKELERLGEYLVAGGFALTTSAQNEKMKGGKFDRLRRSLASQGLNEGADWHFVYLKPTHPLYHSFFDFDMAVRDNNRGIAVGDMGLVIGGRLAVLMTAKPLTTESGREGTANFELRVDGTRHLQFTVNTVVFACDSGRWGDPTTHVGNQVAGRGSRTGQVVDLRRRRWRSSISEFRWLRRRLP